MPHAQGVLRFAPARAASVPRAGLRLASLLFLGALSASPAAAQSLPPNELGRVMILEYHKIDRPENRSRSRTTWAGIGRAQCGRPRPGRAQWGSLRVTAEGEHPDRWNVNAKIGAT
jgi:hypothetical protein